MSKSESAKITRIALSNELTTGGLQTFGINIIAVGFGFLAQPLLYEVYRLCLEAGAAEVVFQPELGEDDMVEIFFKHLLGSICGAIIYHNYLISILQHFIQNPFKFTLIVISRN